jgi:hypothetical protein
MNEIKTMSNIMNRPSMAPYILVALFALAVAASTGALLRFGLYLGMPTWAQNYTAVRHAHSHLMYFGWGTLAIMALIWHLLPRYLDRPLPRGVRRQMMATALFALLSFPAFWSNGYGPTQIGSASLPLGSIVSGLNGLTWIVFVFLYVRATAGLQVRPLPVQLWDWAIILLLLAFVGALGLVALITLDHPSFFLHQAMLHLFLDLFATGWFTLALLGLLWSWLGQRTELPRRLPTQSLALCLAPTFFLGMPPLLVPMPLYWIGVAASLGAAALLAWHLKELWPRRQHLPLLMQLGAAALALHLLMTLTLLWPDLLRWSVGTPMRVFVLHNLLLAWLTSVLLGMVIAEWTVQTARLRPFLQLAWSGGVSLMLLSLLALGLFSVLPVGSALLWLRLAAWSTLPLVAVVLVLLATVFHNNRSQVNQDPTEDRTQIELIGQM